MKSRMLVLSLTLLQSFFVFPINPALSRETEKATEQATAKNAKYVAVVHYCKAERRDDFGDVISNRICGNFSFKASNTKEDALKQAIYWAKVHGEKNAEITEQLVISSDCILQSWRNISHGIKWREGRLLALKAGRREDLIKELDSYRSKYFAKGDFSSGYVSCMAQDVWLPPDAGGVSFGQVNGTYVVAKIIRKKEKSIIKHYELTSGSFITNQPERQTNQPERQTNQPERQTNQQNVSLPEEGTCKSVGDQTLCRENGKLFNPNNVQKAGSGNPNNSNNQGENNSTNPVDVFRNTNNGINQTTNEVNRTRQTIEGVLNIFR
jgi:hypothetical protein